MGQTAVCVPVLRALPNWFGIEESLVHYGDEIEKLPTFLAHEAENVVGFVSLKQHNHYPC